MKVKIEDQTLTVQAHCYDKRTSVIANNMFLIHRWFNQCQDSRTKEWIQQDFMAFCDDDCYDRHGSDFHISKTIIAAAVTRIQTSDTRVQRSEANSTRDLRR